MKIKNEILASCALAFIICAASRAKADVIVSLEPEGGDTGNHKYVVPGEAVFIDVHVIITSNSIVPVGDMGLQQLTGNYYSSYGGLRGDLAPAGDPVRQAESAGIFGGYVPGVGINGFSATGSQAGLLEDKDGDGDLDLAPSTIKPWAYWAARNGNIITNNVATDKLDLAVGKISFNVSGGAQAGQSTAVSFLLNLIEGRLTGNGGASTIFSQSGIVVDDAVLEMNGALDPLGASPVPEPATVFFVGGAASGLLLRRRKNRHRGRHCY